MSQVIGIQFKNTPDRTYYYKTRFDDHVVGDMVVVPSKNGQAVVEVVELGGCSEMACAHVVDKVDVDGWREEIVKDARREEILANLKRIECENAFNKHLDSIAAMSDVAKDLVEEFRSLK